MSEQDLSARREDARYFYNKLADRVASAREADEYFDANNVIEMFNKFKKDTGSEIEFGNVHVLVLGMMASDEIDSEKLEWIYLLNEADEMIMFDQDEDFRVEVESRLVNEVIDRIMAGEKITQKLFEELVCEMPTKKERKNTPYLDFQEVAVEVLKMRIILADLDGSFGIDEGDVNLAKEALSAIGGFEYGEDDI